MEGLDPSRAFCFLKTFYSSSSSFLNFSDPFLLLKVLSVFLPHLLQFTSSGLKVKLSHSFRCPHLKLSWSHNVESIGEILYKLVSISLIRS